MIHHTAIISKNAKIDSTTTIGPYCVVGENVIIGKNNNFISHVSITGNTTVAVNNIFYPFSSIGSNPQDLKFNNEKSYLIIGNKNLSIFCIFRLFNLLIFSSLVLIVLF